VLPATADTRGAFVRACRLDVEARKPGNVSFASPGHRMSGQLFVTSAEAAAGPLCAAGACVGRRIEGAMRATWDLVQCNTNLGIVLLCAPLAAAAERWEPQGGADGLRSEVAAVLAALDLEDARGAYAAIALAQPAGLGEVPEQDVAHPPTVGLREAMALAADADRIARQYVRDLEDVFALGLPAFQAPIAAGAGPIRAMQGAFLAFLGAFPDSHIARKHGLAVAHSVMTEAEAWRRRPPAERLDDDPAFAEWDESLKARGLNPGTSADLSVATAMLATLLEGAGAAGMECVGIPPAPEALR
jgi:triphosphoribosyl-dephospho-CoA synthase